MAALVHREFASFAEFYPAYLAEHANRTNRELHFFGSTLAIVFFALVFITANPWWLLAAVASGYGFAWIGHTFVEKNHPATSRHPVYSLTANWVMYWQMLNGVTSF